ncbi:MAG: GNAT family N-acetyltransferase [Firmicutes bacterium]|nr:GNAT family N-acetyltransferase [Bacillota bacterium]
MIDGLIVERPGSADLDSAYTVLERAIAQAFEDEGIPEQEAKEEIEFKKSLILQSVEGRQAELVFMVAKLEGQVVGTSSYGPCGDDVRECTNGELAGLGELGGLYVLPEYQGQGVASAMIAAMLNYLHSIGIEQFCLDCGLKEAQKIWRHKFGAPYAVAKDYWGEGSDHLVWLCNVADYL